MLAMDVKCIKIKLCPLSDMLPTTITSIILLHKMYCQSCKTLGVYSLICLLQDKKCPRGTKCVLTKKSPTGFFNFGQITSGKVFPNCVGSYL